MFLTEKGNTDTGLLIGTAWAGIAPPPFEFAGGQAALRAGYRHQRYNYGLDRTSNQLNNFDFDSSTWLANARWTRDDWTLFAGGEYNRLLSHEDDWNEFYVEGVPGWGVEIEPATAAALQSSRFDGTSVLKALIRTAEESALRYLAVTARDAGQFESCRQNDSHSRAVIATESRCCLG